MYTCYRPLSTGRDHLPAPRIPEPARMCDTPANTPSRPTKPWVCIWAPGDSTKERHWQPGELHRKETMSTHKALYPNTSAQAQAGPPAGPSHAQSQVSAQPLAKLPTASAWHFSTLAPDTFPLQRLLHRPWKAEGSTAIGKAQKLLELIAQPWNSPLDRLTQRKAIMQLFVFLGEECQSFVGWRLRRGNC